MFDYFFIYFVLQPILPKDFLYTKEEETDRLVLQMII